MSNNDFNMPSIANEQINIDSVTKRDGTLAPFDSTKIYNAINKAGSTTGEFGEQEGWLLTAQVLKVLKHKYAEELPSIENIQDIVEQVLISSNEALALGTAIEISLSAISNSTHVLLDFISCFSYA